MSFKFKIRLDTYTFERGDYFRWYLNKVTNKIEVRYADKEVIKDMVSKDLKIEVNKLFPKVSEKEWKRIMKMQILKFIPDRKITGLKRFYYKD